MPTLTDSFTRADNTDIGTDWSVAPSEVAANLVGNRVRGPSTAAHGVERCTFGVSTTNLFAYVTIATWAGSADANLAAGVILRSNIVTRTYYGFRAKRSGQSEVFKYVSGAFTSLSQVSTTWAANDALLGLCFGNLQAFYQNGTRLTFTTDTAVTSAGVGLLVGNASGAGSAADVELDEFFGGDLLRDVVGHPTSDVSATGTWSQATNLYTFVNDYPSQDTANVLTHGTTAGRIIFGSGSPGLGATAVPAGVSVGFYGYKNASQGNNLTPSLYIGTSPTSHDGAAITTLGNGAAAIAHFTADFGINPKSSAPWTVSEINGTGTNGLVGFGFVSSDASPTITLTSTAVLINYVPPYVTAAAAYTLALDAGSHSQAGSDITLLWSHTLDASTSSYAVIGAGATLSKGYTVSLAANTYNLTGQVAGLAYGHLVAATVGSLSLNGTDATLVQAHLLSASTGASSLAGSDVTLAVQVPTGYTLTLDAGSMSHTGSSVTLSQGRALIGQAGTMSLTGTTIGLSHAHVLPADAGSVLVTGVSTILARQFPLVAQPASYSLSGSSLTLAKGSVLSIQPGVLSLSGSDVSLTALAVLTLSLDQGASSVTGTSVSLTRQFAVTAQASTYSTVGSLATLAQGHALTAVASSYTVTGSTITLFKGVAIEAQAGLYSTIGSAITLLVPTRSLSLSSGAVSTTGSAVILQRGRMIDATAGSYGQAGTLLTLRIAHVLPASSSSYVVSGNLVALGRLVGLNAVAGTYASTGAVLTIDRTRGLVMSSTSYTLTGELVDLYYTQLVPTFPPRRVEAALRDFDHAGEIFLALAPVSMRDLDAIAAPVMRHVETTLRDFDSPGEILLSVVSAPVRDFDHEASLMPPAPVG